MDNNHIFCLPVLGFYFLGTGSVGCYPMVTKIEELTERIYKILVNHTDANLFELTEYGLVVSDLEPTWQELNTAFEKAKERLK